MYVCLKVTAQNLISALRLFSIALHHNPQNQLNRPSACNHSNMKAWGLVHNKKRATYTYLNSFQISTASFETWFGGRGTLKTFSLFFGPSAHAKQKWNTVACTWRKLFLHSPQSNSPPRMTQKQYQTWQTIQRHSNAGRAEWAWSRSRLLSEDLRKLMIVLRLRRSRVC